MYLSCQRTTTKAVSVRCRKDTFLLSYSSQDVLQLINYARMSIGYIILLIEIVGDAVELREEDRCRSLSSDPT